jgi:lipopolysaccharide biosynthesis glycosyltransferase
MNKYCVLTIAVGDDFQKMAKITHPTLKAYADRIGADFICVDKNTCSTPHWEKFINIYKLLIKYERIIYLDTDLIVRDDCPSLFDIVPEAKIGMFNEMPFTTRREYSIMESCKDYDIE